MHDNSWDALLGFARAEAGRGTADPLLADEVAATVLHRLLSREPDLPPEARRSWLRTAIRNELKDLHRRAHVRRDELRHTKLPDDQSLAGKSEKSVRRWRASSPSIDAIAIQREQRMQSVAGHVLAALNDRQRTLLLLSMDDSLTHEQIALELGYKNAKSVKSTLSALRKRLREEFGDDIINLFHEW